MTYFLAVQYRVSLVSRLLCRFFFVLFSCLPSRSPMVERFDAVRDGCNQLRLYRLNKYRKGVVAKRGVGGPVGGGWRVSEPLTSHFCVGCPRATPTGNRGLLVRAPLMEPKCTDFVRRNLCVA